ncbi:hypothetical protein BDR06DRAFT_975196 [Suillus hirtellus]|nr:hypothetical protein BDR06DRAFT_975196 [Suillus hirtellus]
MSPADTCHDGVSNCTHPLLEVLTAGAALLAMGLVHIHKSSSGRQGKLRASLDPTYESCIQAAIQGIANGLYKSIAAAAKEQNVSCQTLSDQRSGAHKSRRHAHESQQILSAAQEETLADWCNLASTSATPIHPAKLRASVKEITGQLPSQKWHYGFICRHPSLCISRASGLDPKCARNFNKDTIGEFFEMQKKLDDDYNVIPPEHHWNLHIHLNFTTMALITVTLVLSYIY